MTTSNPPDKNRKAREVSLLTRVFMENTPVLHGFLRRFLHRPQDIEDVVQETYLKAYAAEKVTDIGHPRAYIFSIAKNIALASLLKKSTQITDYIEDCKHDLSIPVTPTAESEYEAQESLGVYCEAIAALPEKCRRVFLLRRVHGLKQREIAEVLGISSRMVEKHLKIGTLKCRDYVNERQLVGKQVKNERLGEQYALHSILPREGVDQ